MSDGAFITMIIILGIVWGGFALLLIHALRREAGKSRREAGDLSREAGESRHEAGAGEEEDVLGHDGTKEHNKHIRE